MSTELFEVVRSVEEEKRIDSLIKELKKALGCLNEDSEEGRKGMIELCNRVFDIKTEDGESVLVVKSTNTLFTGSLGVNLGGDFLKIAEIISFVLANILQYKNHIDWFVFMAHYFNNNGPDWLDSFFLEKSVDTTDSIEDKKIH